MRLHQIGGLFKESELLATEVYSHAIVIYARPIPYTRGRAEHSGTIGFRRADALRFVSPAEIVWIRCNHGTCPSRPDLGMRIKCGWMSALNRSWHIHNTSCGTRYNPFSFYPGHNCHDDSIREYLSVRTDTHWGSAYEGYPCADVLTNVYAPGCF